MKKLNIILLALYFFMLMPVDSFSQVIEVYLENTGDETVYVAYGYHPSNKYIHKSDTYKGWYPIKPGEKEYFFGVGKNDEASFAFMKRGGNVIYNPKGGSKSGVSSFYVDPKNAFEYNDSSPDSFIKIYTSFGIAQAYCHNCDGQILHQTIGIPSYKTDKVERLRATNENKKKAGWKYTQRSMNIRKKYNGNSTVNKHCYKFNNVKMKFAKYFHPNIKRTRKVGNTVEVIEPTYIYIEPIDYNNKQVDYYGKTYAKLRLKTLEKMTGLLVDEIKGYKKEIPKLNLNFYMCDEDVEEENDELNPRVIYKIYPSSENYEHQKWRNKKNNLVNKDLSKIVVQMELAINAQVNNIKEFYPETWKPKSILIIKKYFSGLGFKTSEMSDDTILDYGLNLSKYLTTLKGLTKLKGE
ncbi:MAG: hypothetical protein JXQ93_04080 [Flavobacteriaceae bacterium]